jgi:hypothetical protein
LVGLFRSEEEAREAHYLLRRKKDITTFVAHTLDTAKLLASRADVRNIR